MPAHTAEAKSRVRRVCRTRSAGIWRGTNLAASCCGSAGILFLAVRRKWTDGTDRRLRWAHRAPPGHLLASKLHFQGQRGDPPVFEVGGEGEDGGCGEVEFAADSI